MSGKSSGPQTKSIAPQPPVSLSQPGILQRQCECGAAAGLSGQCEECDSKRLSGRKGTMGSIALPSSPPNDQPTDLIQQKPHLEYSFGDIAIDPRQQLGIQAKLTIGQPNDKYEQEADRVAEQVMRMPDPVLTKEPEVQRSPLPRYSFGKLAIAPKERLGIQAKLAIGQPGDRYEQEADRVAEQVMRMPDKENLVPSIQSPKLISDRRLQRLPESEEDKRGIIDFDSSRIPVHSRTPNGMSFNANARSNHDARELYRHAAGTGPAIAPPIVKEGLRGPSRTIPADVLDDMETLLGHDFTDVRIHTDERAGASAEEVSAHAYTVGRHIVFAPGRFDPSSSHGRRLLAHELTHVAAHPVGDPIPSGDLRISTPSEAAERQAVSVSEGFFAPAVPPAASVGLFRQAGGLVALTGVTVNYDRVTVPPAAGLSFRATKTPANASGVTFSVVGDNASINAGTTVNNSNGAITVAASQTGGSAHVEASQNATAPDGSTLTSTSPATASFNFTAIPSGITSTSATPIGSATMYGGEYLHTFTSPGGGQTALERSHVNELFPAASGTTLNLTGPLGNFSITVNNPNAASGGWDLDSSGEMAGPDHVTWSKSTSARPFIANASNPAPTNTLPQALTATQNFRNLTFPSRTYGAAVVASTSHRRAFEERNNRIKAVTSANNQEVVEDYEGPTVFHRCSASPGTIPVKCPTPPGGAAPAATTSTITVDTEGQAANPTFSIRPPNLGCTITPAGELTPGVTAGRVTVRAGNSANYDEATVTVVMYPPALATFTINNGAAVRTTSQTVTLNNTVTCSATQSMPTHYIASEDAGFAGASWQTYAPAPSFTLSTGYGVKRVYLKLKNDAGESAVANATIEYAAPSPPSPSPAPRP